MAGIVKIPCSKVCFFTAVQTTQKLAHHFLSTLKFVDNVVNSGTEFSTFNPFVVGSTPAGPTIKSKKALCTLVPSAFFMGAFIVASTQCERRSLMTDSNRSHDMKPLNLCEPCAGIQQNWRRAPGHAELVQGANRKEQRETGQATITSYRCDRCGNAWEYENNKANQHLGWSVLGQPKT